jgi:hypothetical protein
LSVVADSLVFQSGDVVRLDAPIGEIGAGLWVVTGRDWLLTLNRLGENEDGDPCTILPQVRMTLDEARQLIPMHLNIYPASRRSEDRED